MKSNDIPNMVPATSSNPGPVSTDRLRIRVPQVWDHLGRVSYGWRDGAGPGSSDLVRGQVLSWRPREELVTFR